MFDNTHSRFFADAKTYWYSTNDAREADYLVGILNSESTNDAIKPFQSAGSLGERDIHKVPLELPFPRFDASKALHLEIATISAEARALVGSAAMKGAIEGSLVRRRAAAREVAALPLAKLDRLVKRLFVL